MVGGNGVEDANFAKFVGFICESGIGNNIISDELQNVKVISLLVVLELVRINVQLGQAIRRSTCKKRRVFK